MQCMFDELDSLYKAKYFSIPGGVKVAIIFLLLFVNLSGESTDDSLSRTGYRRISYKVQTHHPQWVVRFCAVRILRQVCREAGFRKVTMAPINANSKQQNAAKSR